MNDANYLFKGPCERCGSRDARAVYDDGHSFCFACPPDQAFIPGTETGETPAPPTVPKTGGFLQGRATDLTKRGLTKDTCARYGYIVGKMGDSPVHIANYHRSGEIVAQHVRFPDKDFSWIGKPADVELFGQHLWPPKGRRLVITEGEIDCLSIAQAFNLKWPVVSIPSGIKSARKAIQHNLEWVSSFEEVVIAFDDDGPGREGVQDVADLIPAGHMKIMSYQGLKDANELHLAKGLKELATAVFQAQPYRPDGLLLGQDLLQTLLTRPEPGMEILYPKLSQMFYGFETRRIYTFTAGSGVGKSTAAQEILYDLAMRHGQKVGIMALEESVRDAAMRMLSIHANKPLHLTNPTDEEIVEHFNATLRTGRFTYYDHFGSTQVDSLLSKLRYMVVGLECKWVLLDHISIAVSGLEERGSDERKLIDILMTRLRQLVEETGCGLLAIVHLKRPSGDGKGFTEGRKVSLSDLRGSASLEQLSDGVIALERDQQGDNPNTSQIRVLKNRKVGKVGIADTLQYSFETGRLLPEESDNPFAKEATPDDF